jgi:hypothetical protein
MKKGQIYLIIAILLLGAAVTVFINRKKKNQNNESLPSVVDFNIHIRPILSDRCFKCHGPDANKRKASLRLDIADSAYAALKESPGFHAIVPGDPENSQMFLRISSTDTSEQMPPPSSNLKLTQTEIELIKKWIKQGAVYKTHWALIAPQPQKIPETKNAKWAKNEIDRFILERLESLRLSPNEEADKERVLKRVCFDLTGLPPTIEMQERFLNDKSEKAYENIVDELLANKHYGEKMLTATDTRMTD